MKLAQGDQGSWLSSQLRQVAHDDTPAETFELSKKIDILYTYVTLMQYDLKCNLRRMRKARFFLTNPDVVSLSWV